jgi:competence protein ComEC
MNTQYDPTAARPWHHVGDASWLATAGLVALATWRGAAEAAVVGVVLCVVAVVGRKPPRWTVVVMACVLVLCASARSSAVWEGASARRTGPTEGWVELVNDPEQVGGGTRVVVEIEGERFAAWIFGGRAARLERAMAGDLLWVRGNRQAVDDHRALVRHVVGRFDAEVVGDLRPAGLPHRPGNRVRAALRASADETMDAEEAALFRGLVIGDDSAEPRWMVDAFRASGLSHLTAVSGQNVAYLLAGAAPLLARLGARRRWTATVALIAWFALVTRLEPSVLRASAMAVLGTTAVAMGRTITVRRSLAVTVIVLLLVDPMLAWSVGFWLSVGATSGVALATPWWWNRLAGPDWWRGPLAVTLGAQTGVAVPSVLVFGRLPVISLAANLLAMPVAGLVMLAGTPVALAARLVPLPLRAVALWPLARGTRWVRWVAETAARLEPGGTVTVAMWAVVLLTLFVTRRRATTPCTGRDPLNGAVGVAS